MKALANFVTGSVDRRGWLLLFAVLLFMSVHAWVIKPLLDYEVFHTAAARFFEGGPLYREADGDMPFKYAPIVAMLLSPLALLPDKAATFVWVLATAVVLLGFIAWARKTWFPEAPVWATALVFVFILPYHRHLIALGQCDVFILGLIMWSEELRKKRAVASGVLLALACAFKPPFLLFVALAFVLREWPRLIGFAAGTLASFALPMFRYGVSGMFAQLQAWQDTLQRTTAPMMTHPDNQSVFGLVALHVVPPDSSLFRPVALLFAAALFAAVAVPALRIKAQDERRSVLVAATFYLTASLSPLGWRTNLIALVPLFFVMFRVLATSTHPWRWLSFVPPALSAFIGLLVYDLFGRVIFRKLIDGRAFGILGAISAVGIVWAVTAREARSTSDSASREGSSAPGGPSPRPELR